MGEPAHVRKLITLADAHRGPSRPIAMMKVTIIIVGADRDFHF